MTRLWPLAQRFDNRDSLTRDELSNERSFLAYVRVGVTILVALFGISQLVGQALVKDGISYVLEGESHDFLAKYHIYKSVAQPLMLFLCSIGCYMFVWAFRRYIKNTFLLSDKSNISASMLGFFTLICALVAFDCVLLYTCVRYSSN